MHHRRQIIKRHFNFFSFNCCEVYYIMWCLHSYCSYALLQISIDNDDDDDNDYNDKESLRSVTDFVNLSFLIGIQIFYN